MNILFLLLATFTARAETIPSAPNCGPYCSPPMREILEEFQRSRTIETGSIPQVFSGDCYHLSSDYNPDHTHHGYVLLDAKDGQYFMGGAFSFFASENPYRELTLDQARENNPRIFEDSHRLTLTADFAFADMNREHPDTPWKYWLKQNDAHLTVLGQWGIRHQLYCRFSKNP